MFGTLSQTAFLLWTIIGVDRDGPNGGLRLHMLWMLLFLKGYPMEIHYQVFVDWQPKLFNIEWMHS